VLSRSLERIAAECKDGALDVVHHGRAVKHRLLEISRAAKSLTEANQQKIGTVGSGEVERTVEKSRPLGCLIRSVRD
jgi:hypothetical protein